MIFEWKGLRLNTAAANCLRHERLKMLDDFELSRLSQLHIKKTTDVYYFDQPKHH